MASGHRCRQDRDRVKAILRNLKNYWRHEPPVGTVRFGSLRRVRPISNVFGFDRGQPIDRYYIEKFLTERADDICGRVLEIAEAEYTRKFGGSRVVRSDVLHAVAGNPNATLIGDLVTGSGIPKDAFDCIILTQTLQFIYDMPNAVKTTYQALKPGGIVHATFSGISRIASYDMERWGEYWRVTDRSAQRLFADVFGEANVAVETFGNVLAACAFLHGLSAHELRKRELDVHDPDYQITIAVRAMRPVA
jgi:SAM-dependent methyltransferase